MTDPSRTPTEIAVIVVNYGTADLAAEAVESVLAHNHGGRSVEVHLVDNASPGGDGARLGAIHRDRSWGERVILHPETVNHGFGRGNNVVLQALAARDAPPDKVFLLNPDACLGNEAIDVLAGFLDDHPKTGAVGAAIDLPDGTPVTAAFRFPTIASEFERAFNVGPVSRILAHRRTSLPPGLPTSQVDWVAGAAVMFRMSALIEVEFFDPGYFLYYEEVDLMLALHRAGWETWFVAEALAIHHEGAATKANRAAKRGDRKPAYVYDSWRHYYTKNHGRTYAIATAVLVWASAAAHAGLSALRGRSAGHPTGFVSDHWRNVLRPLLFGKADRR